MNALRTSCPARPELHRTACVLVLLLSVTSCKKTITPPPPNTQQATRTYTFKALAGISMGAIGATFLAGSDHHPKIDAVAALGGPLDVGYFLGGFERMQIGGFCPLSKIEDLYKSNPAGMNDPTAMSCPPNAPFMYEHQQDFNHWQYTNNGGDFDRDSYLDLFFDLSLALGNPGYYNPDSPIFPAQGITKDNFAGICDKPIVYNKANGNAIYNKEYNPNGDYDVITFCDGQQPVLYCNDANNTPVDFCKGTPQDFCTSLGATQVLEATKNQNSALFYAKKGLYDPCYKHTNPVPIGLAVDINHNGIRDYFEPVIFNGHERFQDVGKDGCPDAQEDGHGGCTAQNQTGDPNGDNFDPDKNPLGTEGNWIHDEGEPYEDNGLDGVPNTHDYGEGNGKYDDGPNRAHWLASDLRQNYLKWSEQERQSLDVYADGGIRDVFNFGLSADIMTSGTRALEPKDSKVFTDYTQMTPLPGNPSWDIMGFNALQVDYSTLGRNTYIRYGTVNATDAQYRNGDGDHVGTAGQLLDRMVTFVKWMSYHWERVLGPPIPTDGQQNTIEVVYQSKVLGGLRNFSVALPPGYDDPANANVRYPVFTMGHGYGMNEQDMSNITAVFNGFASAGYMLPMIIVYPSGRCCFLKPDGTKDCRDTDDKGVSLADAPYNYERECRTGNFYVNRQGFVPGDNSPYGDAVFEILDYVDQNFRTLQPMTVPLKEN